jgi:hypothetical protein
MITDKEIEIIRDLSQGHICKCSEDDQIKEIKRILKEKGFEIEDQKNRLNKLNAYFNEMNDIRVEINWNKFHKLYRLAKEAIAEIEVNNEKELEDITNDDIDSVWYVKLARELFKNKGEQCEKV